MIPRIARTSSFRLSALYTLVFMVSVGILCGIVYWIAKQALDTQIRATVQNESDALSGIAATSSPTELASAITARVQRDTRRPLHYRLETAAGQRVAGDLQGPAAQTGWHVLVLPEDSIHQTDAEHTDDDGRVLLALGRRLSRGDVLTVATDLEPVTEAKEAILRAFAWATGVSLLLALIGGALLSSAFLRKIDEINRTTRAIMAGNLSERIQTDGTQDELDRLGTILNEMLDRMQALMDGLKQVSNDIAHDLRTPLSRLKQGLEAARHEAASRQELQTAIDAALEEANTALSTFSALLRIAQIESRARQSHFAEVNLSNLASGLVMTYSAVAEDLGKILTGQIVDDIHVHADRELLTQAFANLIENALRHTPPDTKISLSVTVVDGVPVAAVHDDGPGIPDDEQDKVLTRFYRLEQSRTTPGSGLGLALVAAVAALHGVRLELTNTHPGLTITLWFDGDAPP